MKQEKGKSPISSLENIYPTDYFGDLLVKNYWLSKNHEGTKDEKISLIKDIICRIDSLSKKYKEEKSIIKGMKLLKRIGHRICTELDQAEANTKEKYFNILVVCPCYPDDKNYGGEFIRTRVKAYTAKGLNCCVIASSSRYQNTIHEKRPECDLIYCFYKNAPKLIEYFSQRSISIVTHSPHNYTLSELYEDRWYRSMYVYHGFESRNAQRLAFNEKIHARDANLIDNININAKKSALMSSLFKCGSAHIFVSNFLRRIAEIDASTTLINSHVIANPINPIFAYRERDYNGIKRIIMIRSFSRLNYGTDIAINAIEKLLSSSPHLENFITIAGTGCLYEEQTSFLRLNYPGICFINKHLTPVEMSDLYTSHHISLCPSRFDTQGVTLCEAMLTGLVCITHALPAIKEYADSTSCYMSKSSNSMEYYTLIHQAMNEKSETLASIGKKASDNINSRFTVSQTGDLELNLILGVKQ